MRTHLCEGKLKNKDDVSHLRILSNMMEEETHVDNTSFGKQEDICQTLFDIVEIHFMMCIVVQNVNPWMSLVFGQYLLILCIM